MGEHLIQFVVCVLAVLTGGTLLVALMTGLTALLQWRRRRAKKKARGW